MADCREPTESQRIQTAARAPCQTKGRPVEELTVKALLTEQALRRFEPGAYRFCASGDCDIVYFDTNGHSFAKDDLRVPVWQKEPAGKRMFCYCFNENDAAISTEVEQTGRSTAVERVRDHIAAGRCACEVRNPRGVCCLGDVTQAVRRITEHGLSHR